MASKIECTAVNELIDLVQRKPMDRDSEADLLFSAPREANLRRTAAGTEAGTPLPRALFAVELPSEPTEARATMPKISTRKQVFEPTPRPTHDSDGYETTFVPRDRLRAELPALAKKLALPAAALVMVGIGVGAAISMSRHPAATGAPIDYVALTTPPKLVIAPKPAPVKPKLVDVMLASSPPGATATLLDNTTGASTPLGSTPVEATLDPSKQYDVRFELAGRRAATQHLDPATSQKLVVELAAAEPVAAAPTAPAADAAPEPAKADRHHRHHHTAAAKKAAAKRVATAPSARRTSDDGAKPSDLPGFVTIATNVPCAILLDGTNTGKTCPAKLSVPAGHHSIRLIAAAQHVNKQLGIDVAAKKTTRIDQTF